MLTLFHSPGSRSSAFIWLLEELSVEYEVVYCDIRRRSGKGAPDPRNAHPEKRVPALMHDGELVTEQSAIALYLTDAFPDSGFGRSVGERGRASYLTWLAFFAGEVDPVYNARMLYGANLDPMTIRDHARVVARVEAALARGPYLMGNSITAADVLMSGPFEYEPPLALNNTVINQWIARLADRPAAKRAGLKDAAPSTSIL